MSDDLIRRAEAMANVIEYARAARVSPAYTDDTYLRMIRDLLAEVNRLREHLDALDTDDLVLVRALMAESEAGKVVQRVEALADKVRYRFPEVSRDIDAALAGGE